MGYFPCILDFSPAVTVATSVSNGAAAAKFVSQQPASVPSSRGRSPRTSPSPAPDASFKKSSLSQGRNFKGQEGYRTSIETAATDPPQSTPVSDSTATPERETTVADSSRTGTGSIPSGLMRKMSRQASKSHVIDVMAELEKRKSGKAMINLVVIGHVDAGKSTLMGHLLHLLGNVSQKSMHKYTLIFM
jgi:elongation factor 1 alpha-like protein